MIYLAGAGLVGYGCYDICTRKENNEIFKDDIGIKGWPILKGEFLIGCGASLLLNSISFINDPLLRLNENSNYQDIIKAYKEIVDGIGTSLVIHTSFNLIGATPISNYIEKIAGNNVNVPLMFQGFCTTHIFNVFISMTDVVTFFENIGPKIQRNVDESIKIAVRRALNNATTHLSMDVSTGKVEIASPNDKIMVRWVFFVGVIVGCGLLKGLGWLLSLIRDH